ncbi:hypothetical protein KL86DYS1_11860 [uncultured Dysgonomonas sp.]|uniref:Uncharacterized protein n=1 Tax=uncultured Dysgonomonas sp. TaxID=206096 RepID=A0A212JCV9_9BACT|nr:hypothetical protein KL86DYS1_11860 [uncultured Dysgonomonas sp.]
MYFTNKYSHYKFLCILNTNTEVKMITMVEKQAIIHMYSTAHHSKLIIIKQL